MDIQSLAGRKIDDDHYSGLIESLLMISIVANTGLESQKHLSKKDLIGFLEKIARFSAEGQVFAGVKPGEAQYVQAYLLKGLSFGR